MRFECIIIDYKVTKVEQVLQMNIGCYVKCIKKCISFHIMLKIIVIHLQIYGIATIQWCFMCIIFVFL
jgi:hypothetical protein